MWENKINWDKEIQGKQRKIYEEWLEELPLLQQIKIPRWIEIDSENQQIISLHVFCDASAVAYATAIFIRIQQENIVHVHLLQAKSRIAPIKKLSISRLSYWQLLLEQDYCLKLKKC